MVSLMVGGQIEMIWAGCFPYVDEAGVDVVTTCFSVPGGQLDPVVIVWVKIKTLLYERKCCFYCELLLYTYIHSYMQNI